MSSANSTRVIRGAISEMAPKLTDSAPTINLSPIIDEPTEKTQPFRHSFAIPAKMRGMVQISSKKTPIVIGDIPNSIIEINDNLTLWSYLLTNGTEAEKRFQIVAFP